MIVYCIYHFTIYTHLQWYLLCINSKCSHQPPRILHFEVEEFEFELNEVYSIDIVMSTGEGMACSRYLKICEVCMKARQLTSKALRCSQAEARKPRSEILSTRELQRAQRLRLQTQKLYPDMHTMSLDVTRTSCWGGEHVQLKDTESETVHLRGSDG